MMNLVICLSEAEGTELATRAAAAGMSTAALLECFAGDLTGGEHTGGSDERELAHQWYERRCLLGGEQTFLQFLVERGELDILANSLGAIAEDLLTLYREYEQSTDNPQNCEEAENSFFSYASELDKLRSTEREN